MSRIEQIWQTSQRMRLSLNLICGQREGVKEGGRERKVRENRAKSGEGEKSVQTRDCTDGKRRMMGCGCPNSLRMYCIIMCTYSVS